MVATLGETTGYFALVRMRQKMAADSTGRQILELVDFSAFYDIGDIISTEALTTCTVLSPVEATT